MLSRLDFREEVKAGSGPGRFPFAGAQVSNSGLSGEEREQVDAVNRGFLKPSHNIEFLT